jgi:hypothetical protein
MRGHVRDLRRYAPGVLWLLTVGLGTPGVLYDSWKLNEQIDELNGGKSA